MTIDEVLRNPIILKDNFNRLFAQYKSVPYSPVNDETLKMMPSTHTFGYEKVFDNGSGLISHSFYPYKEILFNNRELQSEELRRRHAGGTLPGLVRAMTRARAYGLDRYVFAYLGLHEYYYARSGRYAQPAFGLFLTPDIDKRAMANATLYDLESKLAVGMAPENITLEIADARNLTAVEIAQIYVDFFNYWVCSDYVSKNYHDADMWEQKREFHYRENVGIDAVEAVIWPIEMINNDNDEFEPKSDALDEVADFQRLNRNIRVYKYQWFEPYGLPRFSFASYLVSRLKYEHGVYIEEKDFEEQFIKEHPNLN